MKMIRLVLLLFLAVSLFACSSKVVPPGTVIVVLTASGEKSVHTEGAYTAYGRDRVYFVDTKLKSFTEQMQILCADKVNMKVDAKWLGNFHVSNQTLDTITSKVPAEKVALDDLTGFQLSLDKFYKVAVRDIVRSAARRIVAPYTTENIQESRLQIEKDLRKEVLARLKDLKYPLETSDVMISNLDFGDTITKQREAIKNAELEDERQAALAKAAVAQAQRDEEIAMEQGKAAVAAAQADAAKAAALAQGEADAILLKAKAQAKANDLISKSLTKTLIQYRAIDKWDGVKPKFMSSGSGGEFLVDIR
jgi:regulator of protease activity HflC (stomatin/prohibitin superfamily)